MSLAPIPWAQRVWALPFLTALTPSERFSQQHRQRHKPLTSWARQLLLQLRRWLPDRDIVLVADQAFSALDLLTRMQSLRRPITCITRLRTDARLFAPPPARRPRRAGRPRLVGKRLSKLQQLLRSKRTSWTKRTIPHWYGATARPVEYLSGTALWYHGASIRSPFVGFWSAIRCPVLILSRCCAPIHSNPPIRFWLGLSNAGRSK